MGNVAKISDLNAVIGQFISIALTLVGIAVVIMFIVAGFNFLNAGGDKEASARARNTLTFAILGLVLAVSAWMIIIILHAFLGLPAPGLFNICITPGC